MSEPFTGEIMMFGGNYAVRQWAFCNGSLLDIPQHNALFSLFGTMYGGDGRTTFGLPNLQGRVPVHQGTRPGGVPRVQGAKGGHENVTLTPAELPPHTHSVVASTGAAISASPGGHSPAVTSSNAGYSKSDLTETMSGNMVTNSGGGTAHTNMAPFLAISFLVALTGIYPSRN